MAYKIQIRRDTTANWDNVCPVLADGEIGFDTDKRRFKIGDGSMDWSELPFVLNQARYQGNVVINFGKEENKAKTTVNFPFISIDNLLSIIFIPIETAETSLDDFNINGVSFAIGNILPGYSFDIIGTAVNDASGNYTVNYVLILNN